MTFSYFDGIINHRRLLNSSLGFKLKTWMQMDAMYNLWTPFKYSKRLFQVCLSDIDHPINYGCPLESNLSYLLSAQLLTSPWRYTFTDPNQWKPRDCTWHRAFIVKSHLALRSLFSVPIQLEVFAHTHTCTHAVACKGPAKQGKQSFKPGLIWKAARIVLPTDLHWYQSCR